MEKDVASHEPRRHIAAPEVHRHLAPTLLIGLGGSGKDALLRVRRLFSERYGTTGYPIVGYLALDTDRNAFTRLEGEEGTSDFILRNIQLELSGTPEAIDCSVSPHHFMQYFQGGKRNHPHVFRWLLPQMDRFGSSAIVAGAGQQRPFGRLAFFHHFQKIRFTLEARLRQIIAEATPEGSAHWRTPEMRIDPQRLEVIFIYSLAGGTGAGMFLDMGLLARHVVQEHFPGVQAHFTHIAILPEVFVRSQAEGKNNLTTEQVRTMQENAFACLREMEYFSMRPTRSFDLSFPPPVPKGDGTPTRQPWYTAWWDQNEKQVEIATSPWDTCYLVGGNNDLMGVVCLSPGELYQMIAEYVFLDFDPNRFGLEKRSLRPNLIDATIRPLEDPVRDEHGHVLYHHYVTRRFSTFGLSQIYFDRARFRRAASYRMAWLLVNRWWLRQPDLGPDRLAELAKRGLEEMLYERLRNHLLRINKNEQRTWWDEVDQEVGQLQREVKEHQHDQSRGEIVTALLSKHAKFLGPEVEGDSDAGKARKMMAYLRKQFDAESAGIATLLRRPLQDHGVRGAALLFREYGALGQQQLQSVEGLQQQRLPMSKDWEDRVADARGLWWVPFCARAGVRIELDRALHQTCRHLKAQYHLAVAEEAKKSLLLYQKKIVGVDKNPEGSCAHFLGRFQRVLEDNSRQLKGVTHYLADRFKELSTPSGAQNRTIALVPNLGEREYDQQITQLLTTETGVNWEEVEGRVFAEMRRADADRWGKVNSLADLLFAMLPQQSDLPAQQTVDALAESLVEACESELRGFAGRLSALDLFNQDVDQQEVRLNILRTRSAPFLRRSQALTLPPDADPRLIKYLGIAGSGSPEAELFRDRLRNVGGATFAALEGAEAFEIQNNAIVLYQEKAGIPLCYYADLDRLGDLYRRSLRAPETHFDYPAMKGRLPDIRRIDVGLQVNLLNSLESTLYGIMMGILRHDLGQFRLTTSSLAYPLGTQFEDVFTHTAENEVMRSELQAQVESWMSKGLTSPGGNKLALLWCATQYLHEEVRDRLQYQINRLTPEERGDIRTHPLMKILTERMLPRLRKRIEGLPDGHGPRWLRSDLDLIGRLDDINLQPDERRQITDDWKARMGKYLKMVSDDTPIPVILPGVQMDFPNGRGD